MNSHIIIILKSAIIFSIVVFFTQCSSSKQLPKFLANKVVTGNIEKGDSVEVPQFPGGERALYQSINEKLQYPDLAKQNGIEGKLYVTFIVTKEGNVDSVHVDHGIGFGCDEEAIRVIKLTPKWTPGKKNGVPVNVRISIPIVFKLD